VPNGEEVYDNCGEECIAADPSADCSAYCDADSSNDCVQDCAGTWGGGQVDDECEVCSGDNSSCSDCAGVPNGEAVYDNCGEECIAADPSADCSAYCDADSSNDCVQDCAGNWGGILEDDECGTCGGTVEDESDCGCDGDEVMDCSGICGGDNVSCLSIEELIIPQEYNISSIYPNPFNPTITISFTIPEFGLTTITAYDLKGRKLETLINEVLSIGNYSINWNASSYPSGVYLIRMESGDFTQTQKVLLVK
jgi:hypothetical protein